ncbi:anti-sigma factor [Niabella hirudinis]|uniref:anti-sigma factor n=1 Tax=Niabella hirudinis TaxID=1285929 RepID=UPI003EBEFAD4
MSSNRLEDFIRANKGAFDDQEPSAALWKRLEKKMQAPDAEPPSSIEPATAKIVKINWWKWTAAAMILITAGVLSKPFWKPADSASTDPDLAVQTQEPARLQTGTDSNEHTTDSPVLAFDESRRPSPDNHTKRDASNAGRLQAGNEIKEELYHYTRLIEIKQKEIATLKNNDPALFEQFSEDLTTLNRSYASLKHQYDEGLNGEQLLSAMIENLKLQTELLNRQLEITKKLKQQKNEATYKNI